MDTCVFRGLLSSVLEHLVHADANLIAGSEQLWSGDPAVVNISSERAFLVPDVDAFASRDEHGVSAGDAPLLKLQMVFAAATDRQAILWNLD